MHWTVLDLLSEPGRVLNEDGCGTAGRLVWILDGAVARGQSRFSDAGSDAAWLVGFVHDRLTEAAGHGGDSISAVLVELERAINKAYGALPAGGQAVCPTTCLGLLKITDRDGDRLLVEAGIVADSVVLLDTGNGVLAWSDDRVKPFEEQAFAVLSKHPRIGGDPSPQVWAQIQRNRERMNLPDGYAVVAPGRPWMPFAMRQEAKIAASAPVVLMSDGFFRLHDVFGRYSIDDLYRACVAGKARDLLRELRDLERSDPAGSTYRRFKIHDDATVMVVRATAD
jgi:hypothetical protein